jgi:alkanesulfonate monooxygenase SsuD/methylene tetrahydromethanopterin reductase-like flavin-dependent oxidoreductase (luciferase family)
LEVVEKALAALFEPCECYGRDRGVHGRLCDDARAALALVRKMRADAVVGSHDALVEALREIAEHGHPGNTLSGYHDLQAIARRALASLTDEEQADG